MRYFDLHCDTLSELQKTGGSIAEGDSAVTLQKGESFESWCQCFAIWTPDTLKGKSAWQNYTAQLELLNEQAASHSDKMVVCKNSGDIASAVASNKCAAIVTVENGSCIGGDLSLLPELKKNGVKVFSFTWNGANELGYGVNKNDTLTLIGRRAVVELNKAGIIIDVSHIAEKGFYDILNLTSRPIIATHSNSRKICGHPRNLTDEQFEAIVHTGGIVGINFFPNFISNNKSATFNDIIKHIDHFLKLGGENNIAIGSDFDGATMPKDLSDLTKTEAFYEALISHGFGQKLADKIMFENAYNFAIKYLD